MVRQSAFTIKYEGLVNVLKTEVGVCLPFLGEPNKKENIKIEKFIAIWDTGATGSVITKKVADKLGLKPIKITNVYHAGGVSKANVYLVNIGLPSNVMMTGVKVTEAILQDNNAEILIGMDIIGAGDFTVTNYSGKTTMSFRVPSCTETDYVPEAEENNIKNKMNGMNRKQRRIFESKMRKKKKSNKKR